MNVLILFGGALAFLIVLMLLSTFAPSFMGKLGRGPNSESSNGGGGSYSEGGDCD